MELLEQVDLAALLQDAQNGPALREGCWRGRHLDEDGAQVGHGLGCLLGSHLG
jgi:hypothetical protein